MANSAAAQIGEVPLLVPDPAENVPRIKYEDVEVGCLQKGMFSTTGLPNICTTVAYGRSRQKPHPLLRPREEVDREVWSTTAFWKADRFGDNPPDKRKDWGR